MKKKASERSKHNARRTPAPPDPPLLWVAGVVWPGGFKLETDRCRPGRSVNPHYVQTQIPAPPRFGWVMR